jgi:hypothetical protein
MFFLMLALLPAVLFAQQQNSPPQKFALVIGNGAYTEPNSLKTPINDAFDMGLALRDLGFGVDLVLNGSLEETEEAITQFTNKLGSSGNSYGFLFYAGHGAQSNGENFLIPADSQITEENDLRTRAVSVQKILDDLEGAKNSLNVVVLDACRDNRFGLSGGQGLAAPIRQPSNTIIVYAAGAGQTAADSEGRNSVFTEQLKKGLKNPRLEVKTLINRIAADVSKESGRRQIPAVYNQFSGRAYLGVAPGEAAQTAAVARLGAVGASAGTSFSAPWLIGTVHGTLAPWRYSFLELGFDAGFFSGYDDVSGYYSLYPFAHYAFFMPFSGAGGWYAGAGGGYMFATYGFPEKEVPNDTWAVDFCTGIIIGDIFTFSYTLRTNFTSANHKVAVGFVKRFR